MNFKWCPTIWLWQRKTERYYLSLYKKNKGVKSRLCPVYLSNPFAKAGFDSRSCHLNIRDLISYASMLRYDLKIVKNDVKPQSNPTQFCESHSWLFCLSIPSTRKKIRWWPFTCFFKTITLIIINFFCPRNDRLGHIVIVLSVCMFACLFPTLTFAITFEL